MQPAGATMGAVNPRAPLRGIAEAIGYSRIGSTCRATIKVRTPDNQDEKVVGRLVS